MVALPDGDGSQLSEHYKKKLREGTELKSCCWCKTPNIKKHAVHDCPEAHPKATFQTDLNLEICNAGQKDFALAYIQQLQRLRYARTDRQTPFTTGKSRLALLETPDGPALSSTVSMANYTAKSPVPPAPPDTTTVAGSSKAMAPKIDTVLPIVAGKTSAAAAALATETSRTVDSVAASTASTNTPQTSQAPTTSTSSPPPATTNSASNAAPTTTPIPITYDDENVAVLDSRSPKSNDMQRGGLYIKPKADTASKLTALNGMALDFPPRPAFMSTQNWTYTNHFQISFDADLKLYKYTIEFDLPGKSKRKIRALIKTAIASYSFLKDNEASFATDHFATIISWKPLHEAVDTSHVPVHGDGSGPGSAWHLLPEMRDEPNDVRVRFIFEGIVDIECLLRHAHIDPNSATVDLEPTKRALNILISKCFGETTDDMIQIGANKFFNKRGSNPLAGQINPGLRRNSVALCTLRGYYYTVKAGVRNVLFNINPCTSAFFNKALVSAVMNDTMTFKMWEQESVLKGLRVRIMLDRGDKKADPAAFARLNSPQARVKTIQGLGRPLREETFDDANGVSISVLTHLQNTYPNRKIQQPDLPAVNLGSSFEPKWYAPEDLLIVPYQMYTSIVPSALTDSMLQVACLSPLEAAARVDVEALKALGILPTQIDAKPLSKCPVLTLNPQMLIVPSGQFPCPRIQYKNDTVSDKSSWNLLNRQFYRPQKQSFRLLTLVEKGVNNKALQTGIGKFIQFANSTYNVIDVQSQSQVKLNDAKSATEITKAVQDYKTSQGQNPELILLVLKTRNVEAYSRFKDLADRTIGCHSICMTERIFGQSIAASMGNIMMKANLKCGGSNHTIKGGTMQQIMAETLVLGADVTHPTGSSILGCPSIAAIVGSVDDHAGRFLGSMRLQSAGKKEIIDSVESMVVERIKDWVMMNNFRLPKNIIYYRDGVSEGQYKSVRDDELPQILTAFKKALQQLKQVHPRTQFNTELPKLTAIACAKRHHVRFYPIEDNRTTKNGNCLPGTYIDDVVTSPYYPDFYLQSHTPLQGTARPAHYFILLNESPLTIDDLRQLTHELCFTYVRTTGAVSYASPAYYADQLCNRGRCYLRDFFTHTPESRARRCEISSFKASEEASRARLRGIRFGPLSVGGKRRGKSRDELVQEDVDRREVLEACAEESMRLARGEFYGDGEGGNPWSFNVAGTMFWM